MRIGCWIFLPALAATLVVQGCAPQMVKTVEIGNPRAVMRVLIASESSDFKQAVIEKVVAGYDQDSLYFKITDLQNLADETASSYAAVMIINSCVAWQLNPKANAFIRQADTLEGNPADDCRRPGLAGRRCGRRCDYRRLPSRRHRTYRRSTKS